MIDGRWHVLCGDPACFGSRHATATEATEAVAAHREMHWATGDDTRVEVALLPVSISEMGLD